MSITDVYEIPHRSPSNRRSHAPRDEYGFLIQPEIHVGPPYPDSEVSYEPPKLAGIGNPLYEASDLSVEEIRREFPPPGPGIYCKGKNNSHSDRSHAGKYDNCRPLSHRGRESDRDTISLSQKSQDRPSTISSKRTKSRRQSLSRNEILMIAAGGAALAVGAKELWDRRKSEGQQAQPCHSQTAKVGVAGAFAPCEATEKSMEYAYEDRQKENRRHKSSKSWTDHGSETQEPKPIRYRRSRSSHRSSVYSDGQSRGRRDSNHSLDSGGDGRRHHSGKKLQKLAKMALLAGAAEAFRVRREPGGWAGVKGKRVLTAAIGAITINNPTDENSSRIHEAILGGLARNNLLNSSRHYDDDRPINRRYHSRSRSRSRSRGSSRNRTNFIATLVSSGLHTLAGNENIKRHRSQSKSNTSRRHLDNSHSHRRSSSSFGNGHGKPTNETVSVVDLALKGLAALRLGSKDDKKMSHNATEHRKSHRNGTDGDGDHSQKFPQHQSHVEFETNHYQNSKNHHHRDHSITSKRSVSRHGQNDRYKSRDRRNYGKSNSSLDSSDGSSWSQMDGNRYKRRE